MRVARAAPVAFMLVVFMLMAAGCSSTEPEAVTSPGTSTSPTSAVPADPAVTTPATTLPSTTVPEAETPTTTEASGPICSRITDFQAEDQQASWRVTLDGVMGGLSSGQVAFEDSVMVFTGEIVTDGGGFSLLRTPLGFDTFAAGSFLNVRARTDGRRYEMVFKDADTGNRSRLFHEALMPFEESAEWQEVQVALSDLPTTINGFPVDAEAFDKDAATEMGIILKDGVDGEFRLEIDWVDICDVG